MTQYQIQKALALGGCTFLPGCYDKRFARDIAYVAKNSPDRELTVHQAWFLDALIYKYRRQLRGHIEIPEQRPVRPPFTTAAAKNKIRKSRQPRQHAEFSDLPNYWLNVTGGVG